MNYEYDHDVDDEWEDVHILLEANKETLKKAEDDLVEEAQRLRDEYEELKENQDQEFREEMESFQELSDTEAISATELMQELSLNGIGTGLLDRYESFKPLPTPIEVSKKPVTKNDYNESMKKYASVALNNQKQSVDEDTKEMMGELIGMIDDLSPEELEVLQELVEGNLQQSMGVFISMAVSLMFIPEYLINLILEMQALPVEYVISKFLRVFPHYLLHTMVGVIPLLIITYFTYLESHKVRDGGGKKKRKRKPKREYNL